MTLFANRVISTAAKPFSPLRACGFGCILNDCVNLTIVKICNPKEIVR